MGNREYTAEWSPDAKTEAVDVATGFRLRYLRVGQGQPVVLLHTLRTQLDYFEKLVPALQDRYQVYAVDLPGHGQSTILRTEYTEKLFRESIVDFIRRLELRDVILVGESIGGVLALTVSAEIPERISRVVSLNPYDYGEQFGGGIRRSRGGWVISFFGVFASNTVEPKFLLDLVFEGAFHDPAKLPAKLADEFYRTGKRDGYRWMEYSLFKNWRTWLEAREVYPRVMVPVTLVYSQDDWSAPADRIANEKTIRNAKFVELKNAGHFSVLEKPEEVASLILSQGSSSEGRK